MMTFGDATDEFAVRLPQFGVFQWEQWRGVAGRFPAYLRQICSLFGMQMAEELKQRGAFVV